VQPRDAPLEVEARVARVGRALGARCAATARAPHRRRNKVAAREAVTVALDGGEQLVTEHEPLLAVRRDSEQSLGDLAIGAADADLERPQQHLVRLRPRVRHLFDARRVRDARNRDERVHQPGRVPRTAPSEAEPTSAR
jgi:hypothetical protein